MDINSTFNNGVIIQWFQVVTSTGYTTVYYPISLTMVRGFVGFTSYYDPNVEFSVSKIHGGILMTYIKNGINAPLTSVGVNYTQPFAVQFTCIGI